MKKKIQSEIDPEYEEKLLTESLIVIRFHLNVFLDVWFLN